MQLLTSELAYRARDVVGTAHAAEDTGFIFGGLGPRRLIGPLGQRIGVGGHANRRSHVRSRGDNLGRKGVLANREKRHASTVNTPPVHFHGLKLGGHACIEDALAHVIGNAGAIVEEEEGADTLLFHSGDVDGFGAGIAGVAKHLDDNVLDVLDIVLGLTTLGLGNPKLDEAVTQVLLNPEVSLPRHRGDKRDEVIAVCHVKRPTWRYRRRGSRESRRREPDRDTPSPPRSAARCRAPGPWTRHRRPCRAGP